MPLLFMDLYLMISYKDDIKVTIVATGVDQRAPTLAIDNEPSMTLNPVGLNRR
jgi:cell division protein FtsZ